MDTVDFDGGRCEITQYLLENVLNCGLQVPRATPNTKVFSPVPILVVIKLI